MKRLLKNIFEGPVTMVAEVEMVLSGGSFVVRDLAGIRRRVNATAGSYYPVGSWVVVRDGWITGPGGRAKKIQVFEV